MTRDGGADSPLWSAAELDRWTEMCRTDAQLASLAVAADVAFAIQSADDSPYDRATFSLREGGLVRPSGSAEFALVAKRADWAKVFQAVPPPAYQNFFGMLMRVPGAVIEGGELVWVQHVHIVRRVLELGREVLSGQPERTPGDTRRSKAGLRSGYVRVMVADEPLDIFYESAGQGRDVLLLHTAGADGRQYHDLMADDALTSRCRFTCFDLPGHGRSDLLPQALTGAYSLTTGLYATTILAVIEELGLTSPIVSGSSMGGEICLEMAYRAPQVLGGVIACEASDHVPGRKVSWAKHPLVNQSVFVPEWVYGLMAPQSPEPYRRKVWWATRRAASGPSLATSTSTAATGTAATGWATSTRLRVR